MADGTEQVRSTLRASALLEGLDDDDLQALLPVATVQRFAAGASILMLGEEATSIYLVAAGKIALTLPLAIRGKSADVTVEEKDVGAVIAWSALVPPHKLTLSARAAGEATLVGLPRTALRALFAQYPRLQMTLMDNLCRVIGSRVSLLEALLIRDLQRWVAERYG